MVKDSLTGEREGWPAPFVVELQVTGGMSFTKRVIRVYQNDHRISYFIGLLHCHDVNLLSLDDWLSVPLCLQGGESKLDFAD